MFISEKKFNIEKIKDTRNYLTHLIPALKENIIEAEQLPYYIRKLKILVEACILKDIGFDKKELTELIRKNNINKHYLDEQ